MSQSVHPSSLVVAPPALAVPGAIGWRLPLLIFAQMLPATLVVAAVRPLFALRHAGNESAMHAFMAVNMLGAVLIGPLVAKAAARLPRAVPLAALLSALDAVLLAAIPGRLPIPVVLALRFVEGAAHVGVASLLMGAAAEVARRSSTGRTMGIAGTALLLSISAGSALGGRLAAVSPLAPFGLAAALAGAVAFVLALTELPNPEPSPARPASGPALRIAVSAAFVARFTVGALIVTFAVFAHRVHALSDFQVGLSFSLLTLPFALCTYPLARLGDRLPRAALLGAGMGVHAACLAALGWVPAAGIPPTLLLAGVASAAIFSGILCYAAEAGDRRAAMAWVNAAGALGMILGPAVAGGLSAWARARFALPTPYRLVFLVAAGSLLAWLLFALGALRRRARLERPRCP